MKDQVKYKRWIEAVLKKWFGRCPHCARKPTGGIHHIIPRNCKKTKYVVENGIPTCFEFHRMWENSELEDKLIDKYIGRKTYELLKKLSNGYITLEKSRFKEIK